MSESSYKSFAFQFEPMTHISLTNDKYNNLDELISGDRPYWCHFEKPSKTLQQKIGKKFSLAKGVKLILFADEVRARCQKIGNGYVLVMQGVQPSTMIDNQDFPTLRFWITEKQILSFSTGRIEAIYEVQKSILTKEDPSIMGCFTELLEYLIWSLEESIYQIDERLNQVESNFDYTEEATQKIMGIRQDIIFLRRYILPQRDALILLANKLDTVPDSVKTALKELSDSMLRQVESIEMLRERAVIIQDNLTNQIAEIANRRMYILTIIMLIFTPPFFIMGVFSMYIPIPGMNSHATWWIIVSVMIALSYGLYKLFKWKDWL